MATGCNSNLTSFVCNGKKILGAAFNYKDIVKARKVPVQTALPVLFFKPTSSYIVEGQNIVLPKAYTRVVHEVELGFIIGKRCKNVAKEDAMSYVGGYCLALDLTAQCELGEARKYGHPWTLGKGFDTACPVSRFIESSELGDPHDVPLWLKVNGEMRQQGNTRDLIFKIPDLIAHVSSYMTLEPNDLILTGTPDGAGVILAGDDVECGMGECVEMYFKVCAE